MPQITIPRKGPHTSMSFQHTTNINTSKTTAITFCTLFLLRLLLKSLEKKIFSQRTGRCYKLKDLSDAFYHDYLLALLIRNRTSLTDSLMTNPS
jgi:hypothetical protein